MCYSEARNVINKQHRQSAYIQPWAAEYRIVSYRISPSLNFKGDMITSRLSNKFEQCTTHNTTFTFILFVHTYRWGEYFLFFSLGNCTETTMSTKKQKQMEPESSSSSEEEASDQEDVPQHTANTATGKSKASNTKENDSSSSSASDSSSEDSSDANEEDVKTEDAGVSKQSAQDAHSSSDSDSDSDSDASETEDTEDKQPQGSHEEAKALTSDTGVGQKRPRESTDTGGDDKADMTVFVEGISYDADENDMKDVFKKCGEILSIRMPRYQDSGKPRGYCHVEFSTSEACNKALNMDGLTHFGRYLTVRRANLPKDCQSRGKKSKMICVVHPSLCALHLCALARVHMEVCVYWCVTVFLL